jgi:hypothetical protein
MRYRAVFVDFTGLVDGEGYGIDPRIPGVLLGFQGMWGKVFGLLRRPSTVEAPEGRFVSPVVRYLGENNVTGVPCFELPEGNEVEKLYSIQLQYELDLSICWIVDDPSDPTPGASEVGMRIYGPISRHF